MKNAGLAPDVEQKIAFTAEERKNFIRPDHAHGAEKSAEMVEFWNQKFKG